MVYLFFALYQEAKPFLEKRNFKKQHQYNKYQVFEDEKFCCIIMGTGPMKTAIHSSHFLSSRDLQEEDIFVNIGFAGSKQEDKKKGELYFIHKIHAHDSGRDFYPELLFRQKFPESSLETFSKVVSKKEEVQEELVDMEGAAFFETTSFFVKRRQIFLYKCVSDFLEGETVEIKSLLEKHVASLYEFFFFLMETMEEREIDEKEQEEMLQTLAKHLFCSVSMEIQLRELLHYARCKEIDLKGILQKYFQKEVTSKEEGKKYVEDLRKEILEF